MKDPREKGSNYDIGTVWRPEALYDDKIWLADLFKKMVCKEQKDLVALKDICSAITAYLTQKKNLPKESKYFQTAQEVVTYCSNNESLKEPLIALCSQKISWLLLWIQSKALLKPYQWNLVNSHIHQQQIKQKLYTFKDLLSLNEQQASNLYSKAVIKALNGNVDLKTAVNLSYLQKQILVSVNVSYYVASKELTQADALKLSEDQFSNINDQYLLEGYKQGTLTFDIIKAMDRQERTEVRRNFQAH